jgi:Na+:H+ antiporter, NhaA family
MSLALTITSNKSHRPRRPVLRLVVSQFQRFARLETSEGILLLICTVIALLWVNSPWASSYHQLWHLDVSFGVASAGVTRSLLHWINDGLMVIFFLVVGMEIKREVLIGELSSLKKASFPVIAALGGMLVPALIYGALNKGTAGSPGWGIPMATDIAFSLGVLTLLGKRIPLQLKIFLMAFAIADDIGAVIIIAVFYATGISWMHLLVAGLLLASLIGANRAGIRSLPVYAFLGVLLWIAFLDSGIHATVAGVILAMTIPARSKLDKRTFLEHSRAILTELEGKSDDESGSGAEEDRQAAIRALAQQAEDFEVPARRFEHALHPWVSYFIVPLFALSNAGVRFDVGASSLVSSTVALGVFLGLVIGKPLGITLFAWIAVKSRLALLPSSVTWKQIYGVAWLGGIGFTMSIFITNLAFPAGAMTDLAKTGIYAASLIAGTGGLWILRRNRILLAS